MNLPFATLGEILAVFIEPAKVWPICSPKVEISMSISEPHISQWGLEITALLLYLRAEFWRRCSYRGVVSVYIYLFCGLHCATTAFRFHLLPGLGDHVTAAVTWLWSQHENIVKATTGQIIAQIQKKAYSSGKWIFGRRWQHQNGADYRTGKHKHITCHCDTSASEFWRRCNHIPHQEVTCHVTSWCQIEPAEIWKGMAEP